MRPAPCPSSSAVTATRHFSAGSLPQTPFSAPLTYASSTSTAPCRRSRPSLAIAERSFGSSSQQQPGRAVAARPELALQARRATARATCAGPCRPSGRSAGGTPCRTGCRARSSTPRRPRSAGRRNRAASARRPGTRRTPAPCRTAPCIRGCSAGTPRNRFPSPDTSARSANFEHTRAKCITVSRDMHHGRRRPSVRSQDGAARSGVSRFESRHEARLLARSTQALGWLRACSWSV